MTDFMPQRESEDEQSTARLLRAAGPRTAVSAERLARVRTVVHGEWRADLHRRRVVGRRGAAVAVALAAAACLALGVWFSSLRPQPVLMVSEAVGTIERVAGDAHLMSGGSEAIVGAERAAGTTVRTGDLIRTEDTARALILFADGRSVRIDARSRVRFVSARAVELEAGAVYVDTGHTTTGLEVRTAFGTARDVGTQFEVRVQATSLELRVRTGAVSLQRASQTLRADAGTELLVFDNDVARRRVPADGPQWSWTASVAPALVIEGRPLAEFLEELAHEQGWILRYADAALAREASRIILHGSVEGLEPADALAVALAASALEHRVENGGLYVLRGADRP